MHLLKDNSLKIFFYFFVLFILSSINNVYLSENAKKMLSIEKITFKGLNETETEILNKQFDFLINKNILTIQKSKIEKQIKKNNFIEKFEVKKIYPSSLIFNTEKAKILAKTIIDNREYFIGSNGRIISQKYVSDIGELPIVFGKFDTDEFLKLNNYLIKEGFVPKDFEKFYYFKNKRWDIKLYEDLLVKLPRENLYDAIKKLKIFLKNNQTYQFKVVDLRIPNQIIIN